MNPRTSITLTPELIAQSGAEPRDTSRLMVIERSSGQMAHRIFRDLPQYLRAGDVLVLNQSKVIPARTFATNPHGTALEVLLVREILQPWAVGGPAQTRQAGQGRLQADLSRWALRYRGGHRSRRNPAAQVFRQCLGTPGKHWEDAATALHPRLGRPGPLPDRVRQDPRLGGGPTAGLHFTPELLDRVRGLGVDIHYVTLHVGPGTFKPVHDDPDRHVMHLEPYEVSPQTAEAINRAKAEGRRVIAVGTTVVRTLRTAYSAELSGVRAGSGETQLFIRPGFRF